ncbi:hypothetical protein Nepgr_013518 [Nepenthes gracilis]|uniref:Uncharacterized protein n=1 Tax=Nepenthes gracilis TaxID=150966 RepID=A0AAD3SIF5_NEPGR|nr:hypothetical protein Nepgr_013518 [Nepenthes gracilis]
MPWIAAKGCLGLQSNSVVDVSLYLWLVSLLDLVLSFVGWVDFVSQCCSTHDAAGCLVASMEFLMELGFGLLPPLFWVNHLLDSAWGCAAVNEAAFDAEAHSGRLALLRTMGFREPGCLGYVAHG